MIGNLQIDNQYHYKMECSKMQYRILGVTDLSVSVLSIGTVELGMEYGIRVPNQFEGHDEEEAIDLLRFAKNSGVNLFDTAPSYGKSEVLVGKSLGEHLNCHIATKVSDLSTSQTIFDNDDSEQHIINLIQRSLRNLQRKHLDILQIHNADISTFENSKFISILKQAKDQGLIKYIGASIYGFDNALAAIHSGIIDVLQIPISILDQRLVQTVLPAAVSANIGIIARSVLLKGVLSSNAKYLPDELFSLREAADRCRGRFGIAWSELPQYAIRFCLGLSGVHSVLVGVRSCSELEYALDAVNLGPLTTADMSLASELPLVDEHLLNPSYWNIP